VIVLPADKGGGGEGGGRGGGGGAPRAGGGKGACGPFLGITRTNVKHSLRTELPNSM